MAFLPAGGLGEAHLPVGAWVSAPLGLKGKKERGQQPDGKSRTWLSVANRGAKEANFAFPLIVDLLSSFLWDLQPPVTRGRLHQTPGLCLKAPQQSTADV